MTGKIFINYRRGDDPGFTQALYLRLEDEFGPENLFMDVEGHIKPGDDFVHVLDAQVGQSDILLAVIGPRWSELLAKREGDEDDFVAIEIKSAIDRGKRVVPVLVGGAFMPRADALPAGIRSLARRNAVGLRPERFKVDCAGLVSALKDQLAQAEEEREATVRERAAADEARRQREAQDAARLEAAEARARLQPLEGLDPAQLRKAEELANWQYVGERGTLVELRDHLARYPGGVTERAALLKLEEVAWAALPQEPSIEELRAYLSEFPRSAHAAQGQKRLDKLAAEERAASEVAAARVKETEEWLKLATSTDKVALKSFIRAWPGGQHTDAARERVRELSSLGVRRPMRIIGLAISMSALAYAAWPWIDGQVYGWHHGWDFTGVPNNVVDVDSRQRCELSCLQAESCRSISYDNDGRCYQYHRAEVWTPSLSSRAAKILRN